MGWFSVDIIRFEFYIHVMIMTRTMVTMTMTLTTMTKIPRVCTFFFHLRAQVGHNSYPNIMAFLAGEPDAWQADEECKQEVGFEKNHPALYYILFWEQRKCTDDYVYLDERGLLWKVKHTTAFA